MQKIITIFKYFQRMLHKPTERKLPKRYNKEGDPQQKQYPPRQVNRPALQKNETKTNIPPTKSLKRVQSNSVQKKVNRIQSNINKMQSNVTNAELQAILIEEIKGIKDQLKEIKQQIGIVPHNKNQYSSHKAVSYERKEEEMGQPEEQIQENIFTMGKQNHEPPIIHPVIHHHKEEESIYAQNRPIQNNSSIHSSYQQHPRQHPPSQRNRKPQQHLIQHKKILIDVGKIQPYMKQFKVQATKIPQPYYHGYHKKSSKPVIIKYCQEQKSMDPIFNLYEKLWKNIVKAKDICINKVYDLNQPLANYILVVQANQFSLDEILQHSKISISNILVSLLRALQFFHECGYLYRNMHPYHVMQSFQGNIVLIDFKNMRRFVDMKGKHLAVRGDSNQNLDEFISNARICKKNQGRKDDLEALGYLALYMLEGDLPWNIENMIKLRTTLTLQSLYGKYPGLQHYMVTVCQMQTQDMPNYNLLAQMLSSKF